MQDADYAARIDAVKQRAHGRWSEVLAAAGVEERILRHRNGPCPSCGGTDRFQYTDKFGEGNYHCRQCGPGGGFKLLQAVRGVDFHAAAGVDDQRGVARRGKAQLRCALQPSHGSPSVRLDVEPVQRNVGGLQLVFREGGHVVAGAAGDHADAMSDGDIHGSRLAVSNHDPRVVHAGVAGQIAAILRARVVVVAFRIGGAGLAAV